MHPVRSFFIVLTLFSWAFFAEALPSDRQQPIVIESNNAERNDKLGTVVYQGNVVIKQGTIMIRANKVTVYSTDNSASKIICTGSPAHYQQRPDGDRGMVLASAKTIEYLLDKDQIRLRDDASLEQDGGTISGEHIDYDIAHEVVKAKGDNTGKTRIQMVIPPNTKNSPKADSPEKETP